MPDTKFSFAALKEHIRKYLWIYAAGIVVSLILTNLVWTTTAPRTPMEQAVQIYLADDYTNADPLKDLAQRVLERTKAYDERLEEVEFVSMAYTADDYYSSMLLMTRLTTGDVDAFLCSQAVMDALLNTGAALALDDSAAAGFMEGRGLEPFYATVQDEEDSEPYTILAGYRLDPVSKLAELGAMNNEGAFLVVTINGTNQDTTLRALENMIDLLTEDADAGTKGAEPAA